MTTTDTAKRPDDRARAALVLLTGLPFESTAIEPDYVSCLEDFQDYWDRFSPRYFAPVEAIRAPADKLSQVAAVGYPGGWLIPPPAYWPFVMARYMVADKMRHAAGVPIHVRWDWRPNRVNFEVAGSQAKQSDHLYVKACDLQFRGQNDVASNVGRQKAEDIVLKPLWQTGLLQLSLGLGYTAIHFGMFSGSQRAWTYRGRKLPDWAKK